MTSFAWTDFLFLARRLSRGTTSEADQRTAISRAYYAVFHAASAFIRGNALVPATERLTHEKVWMLLFTDPDPDRSEVGRRGDLLKRLRVSADYRSPFPDGAIGKRVTFALDEADDLIDAVARLS